MALTPEQLIVVAQAKQRRPLKELSDIISQGFDTYGQARNQRLDLTRKLVEQQMLQEKREQEKKAAAESSAIRQQFLGVKPDGTPADPKERLNGVYDEPEVTIGSDGGATLKFKPKESITSKMETQVYYDEKTKSKRIGKKDAAGNIIRSASDPMADAPESPKPDYTQENRLRGDFEQGSKTFKESAIAYRRILDSAKDPSAAGDLGLIFGYMKLLDPASTVREGEFATAQNAGSIPQSIQASYNKALSGERLAPELRKDFVSRARSLYKGQEGIQAGIEDQYRGLAGRYGANPQNVIIDYRTKDNFDEVFPSQKSADQRFSEIVASGVSEDEAYRILAQEGY